MNRAEVVAGAHNTLTWMKEHAGRLSLAAIAVGGAAYGIDAWATDGSTAAVAAASANGQENSDAAMASGCSSLDQYNVDTVPPSIFGQMYKQESGGKQVPDSATEASDQIMAEACNKQLPLSVADTLYEIYESQEQIPQDLGSTIQTNFDSLTPGSSTAQTAENNILNWANIMTPTTSKDPFVVDKGTMEIVATPTGFSIEPANLPKGKADGYRIAGNNQANNSIVQQRTENLGNIFLWTTNGTILVNETIQSETVNLENAPAGSSSSTTEQQNQSTSSSTSATSNGGGGSGTGSGSTSGGQGSGQQGITSGGSNPEGSPGSNEQTPALPTTPTSGVPTTTQETVPTTTQETVPSTTPTTSPTETTLPTTTTTAPPETTTTLPTTTTTAPPETTTTIPYCEEYPSSDECKSGTVPTLPQS